ncbi:hypothetical protein KSS93_07390 [Pseudomonas xanthosomatis]|uniref:hypothetical protein n=1 Tax=Pseudomonas xanthosomatis TaxID=2842356 RepID=UPI001C3D218A|nr:hypothetical protein [Pseudomonas xanthosomatis]QXH47723.1 hypothetical protein KSS93_07390 [Pseudomonas xanthosomatis]
MNNQIARREKWSIDFETFAPQAAALAPMKTLDIKTRHQVRAIITADRLEAVRLLNGLRESKTTKILCKIEDILRLHPEKLTPPLFPNEALTKEDYYRLSVRPANKQIEQIELLFAANRTKVLDLIASISLLDREIIKCKYEQAHIVLQKILNEFGSSQILLRKAALLKALHQNINETTIVERMLDSAGLGSNNVIVSSIVQCFKEDQDWSGLKRSIMSLASRGNRNKYTRDIARIAFHPHAKNTEDLAHLIQSSLQSSLIDALLILKVNKHIIQSPELSELFDIWDSQLLSIGDLATPYIGKEDGESTFYKRTSAFLENSKVSDYRLLIDHFYDDPTSDYFVLDDSLIERISKWANSCLTLNDLAKPVPMTRHSCSTLQQLELEGLITRSAMFNYLSFISEGKSQIDENALFTIMGKTHDLVRTHHTEILKKMASFASTPLSKIIYHLLIARKSKNEADDHLLRRRLQEIVKKDFNSELVSFVESLSKRSPAVAIYTYELCTEDFIAKLVHIIKSSAQITETRAALHQWMGEHTKDNYFLGRARALLIDHQINRVRNELDDNRIYVDHARFAEWFNDELLREFNSVLASMEHNFAIGINENAQLLMLIEIAYANFCSNSIFGVASYLGRRIRHGTFKGHLYSVVSGIESSPKYNTLFKDPVFLGRWENWKRAYASKIDIIIRDRLHIESSTKRDGLIKPTLSSPAKVDIAIACGKNLIKDYFDPRSSRPIIPTLTEYCWRLAEVDLKNIISYMKGQKGNLISADLLAEIKAGNYTRNISSELVKEFVREITHNVTEKLSTMNTWFKRPVSVSPKASLSLLYKAVVAEVKETFPEFDPNTDYNEMNDIELVGGPYHVIYDAFYVVVYNAAKHGQPAGEVEKEFLVSRTLNGVTGELKITIASDIKDYQTEQYVSERLKLQPGDDIDNAHLSEGRSGIRKLHQIERSDKKFKVREVSCRNRKVYVSFTYGLEHV